MNIACPECRTIYRVDPDRVPDGGVTTRCRECATEFRVHDALGATPPGEIVTAPRVETAPTAEAVIGEVGAPVAAEPGPEVPVEEPAAGESAEEPVAEEPVAEEPVAEEPVAEEPEPTAADAPGSGEAPVFGPQDPDTRARRLARALISDIKFYHPDRWEEAVRDGTLRKAFRDEILKSWDEYVEQVGEEMAKKTPYFRDALNEILAKGERIF